MGRAHLDTAYNNHTVPFFVPDSYMLHNIGIVASTVLDQEQSRLDYELFNPAP